MVKCRLSPCRRVNDCEHCRHENRFSSFNDSLFTTTDDDEVEGEDDEDNDAEEEEEEAEGRRRLAGRVRVRSVFSE